MPAAVSLAEHYRRHRAEMELALELGITPREAGVMLRARERQARRAADAAMARCGTRATPADGGDELDFGDGPVGDFQRFEAPWMMRG